MRDPGTEDFPQPPEGGMFRRDFLRFAGAGVAVLGSGGLHQACGGHATKTVGGGTSTTAAKVGGRLKLFTWQGYDLTKPFADWRRQNHITQSVKYINGQFDVASILRCPGGRAYDASSANQAYTQLFQRLGLMQELTTKDVPSLAKMFPFFRDSPI